MTTQTIPTPIFGIVGWKNSGKTTLTTRLVTALTSRGYRVSTVKHAHHAFDVDHAGTDSHSHRLAGAGEVAIVSRNRWAIMHESRNEPEVSLAEILSRLTPCDLVLIEGFKTQDHPKIEARRKSSIDQKPMLDIVPNIVAIASDDTASLSEELPVFGSDAIEEMANFIEDFCQLQGSKS